MTVVEAAACGRIGFDELATATATFDAPPDGSAKATLDGTPEGSVAVASDAATDGRGDDAAAETSSDAAACPARTVLDYCSQIQALAAPPILDGNLDCGPALALIVPTGWSGTAVTRDSGMAVPDGNYASVAAGWRPDGLYVFVDVTDPDRVPAAPGAAPFLGDAVELYIDDDGVFSSPPAYDDPGSSQIVVSAPTNATMPSTRNEIYRYQVDKGTATGSRMVAFPTPSGYAVEAFIVAADLGLSSWPLVAGQKIGFDVAVDVSYPTAGASGKPDRRAGQYFLHVGAAPLLPYQDVRAFCIPTLAP